MNKFMYMIVISFLVSTSMVFAKSASEDETGNNTTTGLQSNEHADASGTEQAKADTSATEITDTTAGDTELSTGPTDVVDGAFDKLSVGDQKIARALMDAEVMPSDNSSDIMTLDEIAAAKSATGWGQVFQHMQAEGLVEARNLGEVVSSYQQSSNFNSATATDAVSSMPSAGVNGLARGHSKSNLPAVQNEVVTGSGSISGRTGAGMAPVNGIAYGLEDNNTGVSASQDISTAAGASIGFGHAGRVGAGMGMGSPSSAGVNTAIDSGAAGAVSATSGVLSGGGVIGAGNGLGHAYGRGK